MASRSLIDLAPSVRRAALELQEKAALQGIDVLIYCTLRSHAEQAALYAQGRTAPGHKVTFAKPGDSLHQPDENGHAWAFDAVPLVNGKAQWLDADLLQKVGEIGEACGLEWAGRWVGGVREKVHFQIRRGSL